MRVIVSNVVKIGQMIVEILRFYRFPQWRSPPSWIFKNSNFYRLVRLVDPICVSLPNFIKIGQFVAEICRIFDFQDGGSPPCWIFKIAILNVSGCKECQYASPVKFRENRPNRCLYITIVPFSKMAAAATRDF